MKISFLLFKTVLYFKKNFCNLHQVFPS